ncbi:MAG TPA: hypothetical protein VGF91_33005 [Solirubrobacteraceae bacterium]|jgi:hypothetical protein
MATQTKSDPITDSVQEATERVAEFREKTAAASKQASEACLSSYESAVVTLADTYEDATGTANVEWVAGIGSMQADVARQIVRAYTSTVRELVS